MIQTIIVYLALAIIFIGLNYIAKKRHNFRYTLIAIFIYSIFMGVRYGVGMDFFSYKNIYEAYIQTGDFIYLKLETGFRFIIQLLSYISADSTLFFAVIAFLQLYFIFLSLKKYSYVWSYVAYTFMFGCIWLNYANALRQILAFSIFTYAIHFIYKKKIIHYLLIILLASVLHNSALILFACYPLFRSHSEYFKNIKMQIILLSISLFLMNINIINVFISAVDSLIIRLGYSSYLDMSSMMDSDVRLGVGFYIIFLVNLTLILHSKNVKRFFSLHWLNIVYDLYFIGVLWSYIFINSLLLNRINYYMYGFQYIVAAFTLVYLKETKKYKVFYLLLSLYILIFIATMYRMGENTSLYIFNWQEDLFYLKK